MIIFRTYFAKEVLKQNHKFLAVSFQVRRKTKEIGPNSKFDLCIFFSKSPWADALEDRVDHWYWYYVL